MERKKAVRVAVAMSGGVDSLRAAALLKESGHDLFAVHMQLMPSSDPRRVKDATSSATREDPIHKLTSWVGIPLHIVDLRDAFEKLVIEPFLHAYQQGLTPNPCFLCNPRIKFGLLRQAAERLGAERLATGHYAKILPPDLSSPRYRLLRGTDYSKDQSYFLGRLTQDHLAHALFPLGDMFKKDVMLWAGRHGFGDLLGKESQEICFIPSGHYRDFLQRRLGSPPESDRGPIMDMDGKVLGTHPGIYSYTIGQRRGLGVPSTAPYYVVGLDAASRTVYVGRDRDLFRHTLTVSRVRWVSIPPPRAPLRATVRIRYRHDGAPAWIEPLQEERVTVRFDQPQRAVTPGQAAVFYEDDAVLGGGFIEAKDPFCCSEKSA